MISIILTLVLAGIIAGSIQYYLVKGVIQDTSAATGLAEGETDQPITWKTTLKEIFPYWVIGIAGAFLTPLIHEIASGGLMGIDVFKKYAACIFKGEPKCNKPDSWNYMVLFGYGIVFGYSCVRLIKSISSLIIGKFSAQSVRFKESLMQKDFELKMSIQNEHFARLNFLNGNFSEDQINQPEENFGDDEIAYQELSDSSLKGGCEVNPKPWKDWREAESLKVLLQLINTLSPSRNKSSDGKVGDLAHQNTDSDHNPWVLDMEKNIGVVTAFDFTHDPAGKCDCQKLADSLQRNKDPRIKYVIWNKKIMNSSSINGSEAWTWRSYSGKNPHNKHIHISVKCDKASYDSRSVWNISLV